MDEDLDFALALSLQDEFEAEAKRLNNPNDSSFSEEATTHSKKAENISIVDQTWELIDPNPNIHHLFMMFNEEYFWGRLTGIEVKWSPRMTVCAGICHYEGRGGLCSVRLSLPLLKLRPRKDLVETLLHEMIHAYLFVTNNNKDRDGHGPEFHKHMNRINKETGTKISVYHTFHDEVKQYKVHWWRCDGPCQNRQPFYGYVKRSMNRAPSKNDLWWAEHQASCNGAFIKIKEPEDYNKKGKRKATTDVDSPSKKHKDAGDIRKYFSPTKPSTSKDSNRNLSANDIEVMFDSSRAASGNPQPKQPSFETESKNSTQTSAKPKLFGINGPLTNKASKNAASSSGSTTNISKPDSTGVKPNIHGMKGPISKTNSNGANTKSFGSTGTKLNGGGTVTIQKPNSKSDGNPGNENKTFKAFSGKGNVLGRS